MTFAPTVLSTGTLSPVSIDSSTELLPSVTTPSTGILSPGRMRTMSSRTTSEVETSTGSPFRMTVALGGARSSSARIASDAPERARISNQWPSRTKTRRSMDAS